MIKYNVQIQLQNVHIYIYKFTPISKIVKLVQLFWLIYCIETTSSF